MYEIGKIKLIIWDLDETIWKGTLSEGSVQINPISKLIIATSTSKGIVNSICSKNEMQPVIDKLTEFDIYKYFVFSSINWQPKGERIKQIIADMNLRAENVLFIDDNYLNLQEVAYYNSGIMELVPEELEELLDDIEKLETKKSRLEEYRILETKRMSKSKFSSNEEFLQSSNIKVEIHEDCLNQMDRIHELLLRTNQLNFTKKRISKEDLAVLLKSDEYKSGYVSVSDKFGKYGVVGFFSTKDNKLEHFLFSCRTMGMGIEQYVYSFLNFPLLTIVGEVAGSVSNIPAPNWINCEGRNTIEIENICELQSKNKHSILFKGPCDLNTLFSFIEDDEIIDCEFTYVNSKGIQIENLNHTIHIVESQVVSDKAKQQVIYELPFADEGMFSTNLFGKPYNIVFLSILNDANLGVYRRKVGGTEVAFGESYYSLTDPKNWPLYVEQKISTMNCPFTYEFLKWFSENYEFEGRITPERIVKSFDYICKQCPQTKLVIMTGVELVYKDNKNPAYNGRNLIHKEINDAVRKYAKTNENVYIFDINKYIHSQDDFYNHYNHFTGRVYYEIAQGIVELINGLGYSSIKKKGVIIKVKVQCINVLHKYWWKLKDSYRQFKARKLNL